MKNLPVDKKIPSPDKKKESAPKKPVPTVETPEPPQVMDPSIPLEKQKGKKKIPAKDRKHKKLA